MALPLTCYMVCCQKYRLMSLRQELHNVLQPQLFLWYILKPHTMAFCCKHQDQLDMDVLMSDVCSYHRNSVGCCRYEVLMASSLHVSVFILLAALVLTSWNRVVRMFHSNCNLADSVWCIVHCAGCMQLCACHEAMLTLPLFCRTQVIQLPMSIAAILLDISTQMLTITTSSTG